MIEALTAETCLTCGRFPLEYTGSDWNCRSSGLKANRGNPACEKWRPREIEPPLPPCSDDEIRAALDKVMSFNLKSMISYAPEPPPGLRGSNDGVVYFINCQHLTKIGTTSHQIRYRMKGMTTDNPFPLRLWALIPGNEAKEREAHRQFVSCRRQGEWFEFNAGMRARVLYWVAQQQGEIYEDGA